MVAYTFYENDNRVMRYAEALIARGDSVDVIALRRPGQSRDIHYRGVHLLRIQKRVADERQGSLAYLGRLFCFLLRSFGVLSWRQIRYRYAIIHVHSVPDFEVFAALIPRMLGAKVILDIHDIVPEFYASKFGKSNNALAFRLLVVIERLSISFAHHTIVANDIWRDRLLSRSAASSKCSTIMNYPDPAIFHYKQLKSKDDRFTMLYPGTINYHQGLDIAVVAFSRITQEVPDAKFEIYGEGPDRRALQDLIEKLGLTDRVVIHDLVPIADVADLMATADLGVIPKRSDSFGDEAFSTKSLEFMAMGVPLIISNTTIDTHYFTPSVVQFFDAGDEADLAAKMLALYQSPEARAHLSEAGRAFVEMNNWGKKKGEYFRLVDRLLDGGVMKPPIIYYKLKRIIPRPFQIWLRRGCARMQLRTAESTWPIDPGAGQQPPGFQGWPEGKQFALVLRHDVDGPAGLAQVKRLADLERDRGLRSAFFFVPRGCGNTEAIRSALASSGFEIGVHGLTHDGLLYSSHRAFKECVGPINGYLREWGAKGFASPSSHHNYRWLHELEMEYDTSSFDTDPFEPQPDGVGTVFPLTLCDSDRAHSYIELPYTLAQDFTIFVILRQNDISVWTRKLEWIVEHRGMALLNTHPDYMSFPGSRNRPYSYDVALYERFLDHVLSKYGESCWHALPRDVARFWRESVPRS